MMSKSAAKDLQSPDRLNEIVGIMRFHFVWMGTARAFAADLDIQRLPTTSTSLPTQSARPGDDRDPQATSGTSRSQPHSAARTMPIGVRVAPRSGTSSTAARARKDRTATSSTGPTPGRTTSGSPALA